MWQSNVAVNYTKQTAVFCVFYGAIFTTIRTEVQRTPVILRYEQLYSTLQNINHLNNLHQHLVFYMPLSAQNVFCVLTWSRQKSKNPVHIQKINNNFLHGSTVILRYAQLYLMHPITNNFNNLDQHLVFYMPLSSKNDSCVLTGLQQKSETLGHVQMKCKSVRFSMVDPQLS